ncbi:hypothetical protein [Undibacterium sp.]|uniref:hypothetical protein n=1 Tax=Undibacterium sp. TaxID=1914977 RepID=UPI0027318544|nr:hypothetical protein [Undibacterium sp.]MDP1980466.1 hypothetical protein [Undibacterium sp.]
MSESSLLLFSDAPLTNPVLLVFGSGPAAYEPVELVFSEKPVENPVTLVFGWRDVVLPPVPDLHGEMAGTFPAMTVQSVVTYLSDTARPVVGRTSNAWQKAGHTDGSVKSSYQRMLASSSANANRWQHAQPLQAVGQVKLARTMTGNRTDATGSHAEAVHTEMGVLAGFASMSPRARVSANTAWQSAKVVRTELRLAFQSMQPTGRAVRVTSWSDGQAHQVQGQTAFQKASGFQVKDSTAFQSAMRPRPGKAAEVLPPVKTPCYVPPLGSAVDLVFSAPWADNANLVFVCERTAPPINTIVIPVKRTYIVLNDVLIKRVEGNHILPATTLQMQIDMDSWTWSFSTSMPASALPLVEPGQAGDLVILEATVNGQKFSLLAEDIQRERTFGKSTISVSGRGLSAMLADPYSPILTFKNDIERTAQQLMNDALMINGVPIGWSVDWRIEDWLVPAGVWSHQGSYMSALTTIANAAGAFIQPDPTALTLRILPRFPVKPWEWASATPDIELPSAAVTKESISWTDKPDYNAVYVSGATAGGILGCVKRAGSAGDNLAPMVTDALITQSAAARQLGISILAETGRNATYSLSLPVLQESGIIMPGKMARYVDTNQVMGVVKGVSLSAELSKVRQTIEVQTHG